MEFLNGGKRSVRCWKKKLEDSGKVHLLFVDFKKACDSGDMYCTTFLQNLINVYETSLTNWNVFKRLLQWIVQKGLERKRSSDVSCFPPATRRVLNCPIVIGPLRDSRPCLVVCTHSDGVIGSGALEHRTQAPWLDGFQAMWGGGGGRWPDLHLANFFL
jgi:hypothetical protein